MKIWPNDTYLSKLEQFFRYFAIKPYIKSTDYQSYLYISYAIQSLIWLSIALMILVIQPINKKFSVSEQIIKTFDLFAFAAQHMLLLPFLEIILYVGKCEQRQYAYFNHISFPNEVCFTYQHFIHFSIAILTALVFSFWLLLHSILYGEYLIGTNQIDAR